MQQLTVRMACSPFQLLDRPDADAVSSRLFLIRQFRRTTLASQEGRMVHTIARVQFE